MERGDYMLDNLSEGHRRCDSCGKEFYVQETVLPESDIKHEIGCPYCDANIGYASGTHDFITRKLEDCNEEIRTCPWCNCMLVRRINSHTGKAFWRCNNYPRCTYTHD